MPVFIVLYLFVVGLLALLGEMVLAQAFPILNFVGISSPLVPLVVIYASLELGDERAALLAFALGLVVDLVGDVHRLGISVLTLTSLSLLVVALAQRADAKHWIARLSYVLIGTFGFLVVDYLFVLVERGNLNWPLTVWSKITLASLFNFLLSPVLFFLIGLPPRLCGWKPARETRPRPYAR